MTCALIAVWLQFADRLVSPSDTENAKAGAGVFVGAAGGSGVNVAVGGTGLRVLVGLGGTGVFVGGTPVAVFVAVGVSVLVAVAVAGGVAVSVAVGVNVGRIVRVGRGVLVGSAWARPAISGTPQASDESINTHISTKTPRAEFVNRRSSLT